MDSEYGTRKKIEVGSARMNNSSAELVFLSHTSCPNDTIKRIRFITLITIVEQFRNFQNRGNSGKKATLLVALGII